MSKQVMKDVVIKPLTAAEEKAAIGGNLASLGPRAPYTFKRSRPYFGTDWAARYVGMPENTFEQYHVHATKTISPGRLGNRTNVFSRAQLDEFAARGSTGKMVDLGDIFNAKGAAEYLDMSTRTVSYHVKEGNLTGTPISPSQRIYTKGQLDEFLGSRRGVGRPRTVKE